MGDRRAAFETLRQAFEIDPTYDFAGYTIFDAQIQSRNFAEAEKTLARIEMHIPSARARAARVRLLCHQKKQQDALKEFRSICFLPAREGAAIGLAASAFAEVQWRRPAEHLLKGLLDEEGLNPEVGAQWVKLFCARGKWALRSRLYQLDPDSELGRRAFTTYIEEVGAQKKPIYLKRIIARLGKALRRDVRCWGQAGYAYANNGMFKDAAKWLSDWRQHPDAQPWMLHNTAQALRMTGNASEALEVSRAALKLRGDQTTPEHSVWVACEEAIAGCIWEAKDRLATVLHEGLAPQPKAVYALTSAVIDVQTAESGARRTVYDRHKHILRQLPPGQLANAAVRPMAKRAIDIMAKAAGARPFRIPGGSIGTGMGQGNLSWRFIPLAVVILSSLIRGCASLETPPSSSSRPLYTTPTREEPPRLRPSTPVNPFK